MTDFYFHEEVNSTYNDTGSMKYTYSKCSTHDLFSSAAITGKLYQNLPISCLVEEGLRSLPAKRIPLNQAFDYVEMRNGLGYYGQENSISSVYSSAAVNKKHA